MTFKEWVNNNKGKKIDYDKTFGVQCVDLIKHYIANVFKVTPKSIGNAYCYWDKRNSKYLSSMFVPVVNNVNTIPRMGDVFVRSSGVNSKGERTGHVGVCTGNATREYFYAYEQNAGGTGEGMTLHLHTNWSTINFLRPKYQYVIANGGLYGYSKKKSLTHNILIPKNSRIEIIETECYNLKVNNTEYTFSRIIYNGKKYYVADKYLRMDK